LDRVRKKSQVSLSRLQSIDGNKN